MSPELVNDLRIVVTIAALLLFIGIALWAWSQRQREPFDEAARLPLEDDR